MPAPLHTEKMLFSFTTSAEIRMPQPGTASPCRIRAISKTIEETETAEQAAYRLVTNHTGLTMSRDFQVGE